jgi:hypothetical protein
MIMTKIKMGEIVLRIIIIILFGMVVVGQEIILLVVAMQIDLTGLVLM